MRPMRIMIFVALALAATVVGANAAYEAYIDDASGIVVARGEAARGTNETYDSARKRAIDNARSNLLSMLERQYIDLNSTTIGKFLSMNPDRRPILDRFMNTARVFSESEEKGKVKVSLLLPYTGPDGYKETVAQMQGDAAPVIENNAGTDNSDNVSTGDDSDKISDKALEELRKKYVSKGPGEMGKPFRIAMFDFENRSKYTTIDLGQIFTDNLRYNFKKDRRFVFVDLNEGSAALADSGTSFEKLIDSRANERFPVKGLDGIIIGTITRYESQTKKHGIGGTGYLEMNFYIDIELKILDAQTGRWVFFETIPVTVQERTFTLKSADDADNFISIGEPESERGLAGTAFRNSLDKVEHSVRASFPLEGYVLKTAADSVYINLTKTDGIKTDDILTVYRLGEVLIDPVTNKPVDRIRDRIGEIKIVDVKDTYSLGKTEDLFGENPAVGDIVMLK